MTTTAAEGPPLDPTATRWGRFELAEHEGRRLFWRQLAWAGVQAVATVALAFVGFAPTSPIAAGLATAAGVAAARPARLWLLPPTMLAVAAGTVLLAERGVGVYLAAGLCAGLVAGAGGVLGRLEGLLAGATGGAVAGWLLHSLAGGLGSWATICGAGLVAGVALSQALWPGALAFRAKARIPSPGTIRATLQEPYRAAPLRASQLDAELRPAAPGRRVREGLGEVAAWVYRLALSLQTLDRDAALIDPEAVAERRRTLAGGGEPAPDPFVAERNAATVGHLDRMLGHREALLRERARAAALQEYALAWLEEARAGLALARVHPGEQSPAELGVVLEKLRNHAAERDAARRSTQEVAAL